MVGQPGPFVGFDKHIVRLVSGGHHQVEADHGNIQGPSRADGGVHQRRVQDRRDILKHAAGMKIRRAPYEQVLTGRQNAVVVVSGGTQGAQGFLVLRDLAFAARGRLSPSALGFDQCTDGVLAVADHFGWPANGGGDHFKTDHHNAQVQALVETFQQHAAVEVASGFYGLLHFLYGAQIHRHPLALFTIQWLDHHALVFIEEGQIVIGVTRQLLRRQVQPCCLEHFVGQAFVLAQGHADGAGQVAQGFTAAYPAPAMAEGEHPGVGVIDVHIDATTVCFFDNDPRVGVERGFRAGPEKQRLIDAVLALDGEGRQVAKTELGVKVFRLAVVVQHRQVEAGEPATHEVFDQMPHQHFTDTRPRTMRVDRQAPQAAAVFRVVEGLVVVEAHDAADDRAAVLVFGQPVHRAAQMARRQQGGIDRQHAAGLIQLIDRLPVGIALRASNAETAKHPGRLTVVAEPQAQGIGRVEEQLRRLQPQHLLGRGDVQGNVPLAGLLVEQLPGQARGIGKGVADQQAPPAAMHGNRRPAEFTAILGQTCLQAFVGGRLAAQQALAESRGVRFHRSDSLFAEPQVEGRQLPQLRAAQRCQLPLWISQ
ncbi:hypothetical protein D3C75_506770 [compost metagenome]